MDTTVDLAEHLLRNHPRTDAEYEVVVEALFEHTRRTLDRIAADRQESAEIGADFRATIERIKAI